MSIMNIEGKNILITGGSKGLGKAMAKELIKKGAYVAITGRDEATLNKTAIEIGAFPIVADVSNIEDVKRTYEIIQTKFKNFDVLINNAGLARPMKLIEETTLEDFEYVFGVNVFGAAMMTKYAAEIFKKQNFGNIINICSTAALKGYAKGSVYSASKFALRGMTQCWQDELRPFNIRVIEINPTYVPTAFGTDDGNEKPTEANKVKPTDIGKLVVSVLEMDNSAFIPEVTVWATNPW